jgi:hypothetical protein
MNRRAIGPVIRAPFALFAFVLIVSACDLRPARDREEPRAPHQEPDPELLDIATIPGVDEALMSEANAQTYRMGHGWKDRQRLSLLVEGELVAEGPLASIEPRMRLDGLTDSDFMTRFVTVARITADGPYRQLGMRYGAGPGMNVNFIALRREGDGWTGVMLWPGARTGIPLQVRIDTTHAMGDHPPPVARWLYDEEDERVWIRCGSSCCIIDGVAGTQ